MSLVRKESRFELRLSLQLSLEHTGDTQTAQWRIDMSQQDS